MKNRRGDSSVDMLAFSPCLRPTIFAFLWIFAHWPKKSPVNLGQVSPSENRSPRWPQRMPFRKPIVPHVLARKAFDNVRRLIRLGRQSQNCDDMCFREGWRLQWSSYIFRKHVLIVCLVELAVLPFQIIQLFLHWWQFVVFLGLKHLDPGLYVFDVTAVTRRVNKFIILIRHPHTAQKKKFSTVPFSDMRALLESRIRHGWCQTRPRETAMRQYSQLTSFKLVFRVASGLVHTCLTLPCLSRHFPYWCILRSLVPEHFRTW